MHKPVTTADSDRTPISVTYRLAGDAPDGIERLGSSLSRSFSSITSESQKLELAKQGLRATLDDGSLLADLDTPQETDKYVRNLAYCDKENQFSILTLYWPTGVKSSIHGHSTWGAVGVYSGAVCVLTYDNVHDAGKSWMLKKTNEFVAGPKCLSGNGPDSEGIHQIWNQFKESAWTIHIYGMDLSEDPMAINIFYAD